MKLVVNLFVCLAVVSMLQAQNVEYHVLFEYNKSNVSDTAMAFLVKTIYDNKVKKIYLEGHCDSIGSKRYNYALSERRVQAVVDLLVENGFERAKISGKVGFGKDKPLTPNSSDIARQKNRRVVVQFDGVTQLKKTEPLKKKKTVRATEKNTNPSSVRVKKSKPPPKELGILLEGNSFRMEEVKKIDTTPTVIAQPKALKRENFVQDATIALPGLNFQGGRHFLLKRSTATLDTLLNILNENPNIIVEIQGHVCCTTNEPDGFDVDLQTPNLSETRAIAVKAFLVKSGISSIRLKTKGFGGTKKLYPQETSYLERERNRRVEIKVLSK